MYGKNQFILVFFLNMSLHTLIFSASEKKKNKKKKSDKSQSSTNDENIQETTPEIPTPEIIVTDDEVHVSYFDFYPAEMCVWRNIEPYYITANFTCSINYENM